MTDDELIREIVEILSALVLRVTGRLPRIAAVARHDGGLQPYASFVASPESESLDLCVLVRMIGDGFECSADLVRGGSGEVLGEMPAVTFRRPISAQSVASALDAVRAFAAAQEGRILSEMDRR